MGRWALERWRSEMEKIGTDTERCEQRWEDWGTWKKWGTRVGEMEIKTR